VVAAAVAVAVFSTAGWPFFLPGQSAAEVLLMPLVLQGAAWCFHLKMYILLIYDKTDMWLIYFTY